ncbi:MULTISPECIES: hypothetical protein [unclassified Streptomyces]|uniref:hypothetical protein n=1 Tax=unclassified Streptomyces TaxID=2593676 RepID=UPI00336A3BD6
MTQVFEGTLALVGLKGGHVDQGIDDQRTWLFGVLRDLSAAMGHPDLDHAVRVLVLLHDGAFQASELDNAKAVRETLRRAVDEVFPAQDG